MKQREKADEILWKLTRYKFSLQLVREDAEAELARVREKYQEEIGNLEALIKAGERELKALMKTHDPRIFDGRDTVRLQNGLLLRSEADRVRIPRDALPKIEAQGWHEAVKVVKSINRDVVAKWPESRLVAIGAEKRRVVNYEYELKAEKLKAQS